jgi:hypothetical protein
VVIERKLKKNIHILIVNINAQVIVGGMDVIVYVENITED